MAANELLRRQVSERPVIYAYSDTRYPNMLKVGFTSCDINTRMHEHYPTLVPGQSWLVELIRSAMRQDGSVFSDKEVHRVLRSAHIPNPEGEWFCCNVRQVELAIAAVANNETTLLARTRDFRMRPEQSEAVRKTAAYFRSFAQDTANDGLTAHFLWNAKMRFGKTFTAYQLTREMCWKHVLVLTFKPAVKTAWKEDLLTHKDFADWIFVEKQDNREFLLDYLRHTYWFLPSVAACRAMAHLLRKPVNNRFFERFHIIVAAGSEAGMGADAVLPVYAEMGNPQVDYTITLSCGKLSTGVTVKPWTGIFMLRNSSSPETYFQAAFRVQSSWTMRNEWGEEVVLKPLCYVFDFAPNRALRQVAEYSCRLSVNDHNPEQKVAEFIRFLPILAYDGSSMKQIDAAGILDMAMSGTTATLLARRWESALLVNVDNGTLNRLLHSPEAMQALMNIEGFRALNRDIETIINKSEAVKKAKKERGENLTPLEKKQLSEEEKEYKSKRKEIQEKLIKFATRIPVFMYLTDYREYTLYDVIRQLEPYLFRKVTGLTLHDFDLLVSLGVFNRELMNDAVYKFKRYEDSSLVYTGINTHEGENIGGFDTVISAETYQSQAPLFQPEPTEQPSNLQPLKAESGDAGACRGPASTAQRDALSPAVVSPRKEQKPSAPWLSLQVGDNVTHRSLGSGTILSIDDTYIKVRFVNTEKKFYFPSCFENGYFIMP